MGLVNLHLSRSRSGRGSPCQPVKGLPLRLRLLPLQLQLHLEKERWCELMLHNKWNVERSQIQMKNVVWIKDCQTCS